MSDFSMANALRGMADALCHVPPRPKIAFTALGSELHEDTLVGAAKRVAEHLIPVIIGPVGIEDFPHFYAEDLPAAHRIMEQMLASSAVAGAVTLHYNFPLGISTVGQIQSVATGRRMILASTTGSSDPRRSAAMVKNAMSGLAMADALGVVQPTVGLLNVDDAPAAQRLIEKLQEAGFPLRFAQSLRHDGGALMRGNDLIRGTPDVMVCDTLTGNLLIKLFSAGQSGGDTETLGCGYGIGLGPGQKSIIGIISRASGPATIQQALLFCAQMARCSIMNHWQDRWRRACECGIESLLHPPSPSAQMSPVDCPPRTVLDDEIHGIDILRLDEARLCLWQAGIFAETGMGCTGPVLMINHGQRADALTHLRLFLN